MKAVVVYKWARDPLTAIVGREGSVDWRGAKMAPGEDDPAALATTKRIVEAVGGELVGLTIGDGDATWALARGVAEAVWVTDVSSGLEDADTAAILAAAIDRIGDVDVVVIGDSKHHAGVPVTVAGILGWPALMGVSEATWRDGRLAAVRTDGDVEWTFAASTPVVLGVAATGTPELVPGMKDILTARKRPLTKWTVADLGVPGLGAVTLVGSELPEETSARIFDGDPAAAAGQLITALRAEGVL